MNPSKVFTKAIMLDTETLSLAPDAMVWQIAYRVFVIPNPAAEVQMGRKIELTTGMGNSMMPHYNEFDKSLFSISQSTEEWAAITYADDTDGYLKWRDHTFAGKHDMSSFRSAAMIHAELASHIDRETQVWARNAAFDFPIINHFFECFNLAPLWHRSQQCDVYTAENTARLIHREYTTAEWPPGFKRHNALDDCDAQVLQLQHALNLTF